MFSCSYKETRGGGDQVEIPQQNPGKFAAEMPPFSALNVFSIRLCTHRFAWCLQVIIECYEREKYLPPLDKTKFLVPHELTMTQFVTIIRYNLTVFKSLYVLNMYIH